jgi:hypothetical protein
MMRMILVAMSLVAIVMMGCGPSATTSESDSGTSPQQPGESDPALLLSEESAISIPQTFLQECVLSWDGAYAQQEAEQQKKSWLMDLAIGTTGDFAWSARYHGVTEVPNTANIVTGTNEEAETWLVIGPGLEKAGSQVVVPGRWKVYAGHQRAHYVDAPARLSLEEYNHVKTRFGACYRNT